MYLWGFRSKAEHFMLRFIKLILKNTLIGDLSMSPERLWEAFVRLQEALQGWKIAPPPLPPASPVGNTSFLGPIVPPFRSLQPGNFQPAVPPTPLPLSLAIYKPFIHSSWLRLIDKKIVINIIHAKCRQADAVSKQAKVWEPTCTPGR